MARKEPKDPAAQLKEIVARLPKNFDVKIGEEAVTIREDWFQWRHALILILLTVVAFGSVPLLQDIVYVAPSTEIRLLGIGLAFFPIFVLFYCALAGLLNASIIKIQGDRLSRHIGPLPWPGGFTLNRAEIHQLFAVHKERTRRKRTLSDSGGPFHPKILREYEKVSHYKLVVGTTDRNRKYVASNEYPSTFVPHTLECVIEALLQIDDCFVAGEVRSPR